MEIVTRRTRAAQAATRHQLQYEHWEPTKTLVDGRHPRDVTAALKALGPTPEPDQVDKVMGNCSWTEVGICHECGSDGELLIQFGGRLEYESRTACLCATCLLQSVKLLESANAAA